MKVYPIVGFSFRLLALPFILGMLLVFHVFLILKQCFAYQLHGGEMIFYRDKEKKMINDCYEKLLEIQKEQNKWQDQ